MKINNVLFLSYLRCPYKAYLLLEGRSGQQTAYETLISDLDSNYKPLAQAALIRYCASVDVATDRPDNVFKHYAPPLVTFDAKIEHGSFEYILDALKRETDGARANFGICPRFSAAPIGSRDLKSSASPSAGSYFASLTVQALPPASSSTARTVLLKR